MNILLWLVLVMSIIVFIYFFTWRNVYYVTHREYYSTLRYQRLALTAVLLASLSLVATQGGALTISLFVFAIIFDRVFNDMEMKRVRKKVKELNNNKLSI